MTTFGELADAVSLELSGFTQNLETAASLTTDIEYDDLVIAVSDINSFSRGLVEIDDELIYVASVDTSNSLLNVAPGWGRGYRGTTPVTHLTGTKVVASPVFPRSVIKRYINETVEATYPTLWSVTSTTVTAQAGETSYDFPPNAHDVLQVTWEDTVTLEDVIVRRWKHDKYNDKLSVYDAIPPGRTVTVYYRQSPPRMGAETEVYTTVTGLPSSTEDVIRLGAVVKLLPYLEANNSSIISAEADFAANSRVSSTNALQLSRSLMQMYQLRLAEEGMKLAQQNPVRIHYTV